MGSHQNLLVHGPPASPPAPRSEGRILSACGDPREATRRYRSRAPLSLSRPPSPPKGPHRAHRRRPRRIRPEAPALVAQYCTISSGVEVHAFDAETGKKQLQVRPYALGPAKQSEYSNDVELAIHSGNVVVHGKEAAGRYVEVLDTRAGRSLSS